MSNSLGVERFPVQSEAVRRHLIAEDVCPDCGGSLDVGWECGACRANFRAIAVKMPESDRAKS